MPLCPKEQYIGQIPFEFHYCYLNNNTQKWHSKAFIILYSRKRNRKRLQNNI